MYISLLCRFSETVKPSSSYSDIGFWHETFETLILFTIIHCVIVTYDTFARVSESHRLTSFGHLDSDIFIFLYTRSAKNNVGLPATRQPITKPVPPSRRCSFFLSWSGVNG